VRSAARRKATGSDNVDLDAVAAVLNAPTIPPQPVLGSSPWASLPCSVSCRIVPQFAAPGLRQDAVRLTLATWGVGLRGGIAWWPCDANYAVNLDASPSDPAAAIRGAGLKAIAECATRTRPTASHPPKCFVAIRADESTEHWTPAGSDEATGTGGTTNDCA